MILPVHKNGQDKEDRKDGKRVRRGHRGSRDSASERLLQRVIGILQGFSRWQVWGDRRKSMLSTEKGSNGETKRDVIPVGNQGEGRGIAPTFDPDLMFLDAPSEDKTAERLPEVTRQKISQKIRAIASNSNAVTPIKCRGERCSYLGVCPLADEQVYPQGKQCPIEQSLIMEKYENYCREFNVDRFNTSDLGLISRMVEIDLIEYRLKAMIATTYPDILMEEAVGVSPIDGKPIMKLVISPMINIRKRLTDEKLDLMKELVGTRKEKYKEKAALKVQNTTDYSSYMADMSKKLKELMASGRGKEG